MYGTLQLSAMVRRGLRTLSRTSKMPWEKSRLRCSREENRSRHTVLFSVEPYLRPSTCLLPWSPMPSAVTMVREGTSMPSASRATMWRSRGLWPSALGARPWCGRRNDGTPRISLSHWHRGRRLPARGPPDSDASRGPDHSLQRHLGQQLVA